jgi:hypothetical protein
MSALRAFISGNWKSSGHFRRPLPNRSIGLFDALIALSASVGHTLRLVVPILHVLSPL